MAKSPTTIGNGRCGSALIERLFVIAVQPACEAARAHANNSPNSASLTSRIWNPGVVNVLHGDGCVLFENSIIRDTWARLGSIGGGEINSADCLLNPPTPMWDPR